MGGSHIPDLTPPFVFFVFLVFYFFLQFEFKKFIFLYFFHFSKRGGPFLGRNYFTEGTEGYTRVYTCGEKTMPIHVIRATNPITGHTATGYQWGAHGHIYFGPHAKGLAAAQARAAYSHGYRPKPTSTKAPKSKTRKSISQTMPPPLPPGTRFEKAAGIAKYVAALPDGRRIAFGDSRYEHFRDAVPKSLGGKIWSSKDHLDTARRKAYRSRAEGQRTATGKRAIDVKFSPAWFSYHFLW